MAILATQTIVGNIGSVYDVRTVGKENREVVDFSVAVTPRKKVGDDWKDGDTYWVNVTAWGKLAVNVEKSFKSGDRVIVYGRTDMKAAYENRQGEQVPAKAILIADFVGHEVGMNPAHSDRVSRGGDAKSSTSTASKTSTKKAPVVDELDDFDADEDLGF